MASPDLPGPLARIPWGHNMLLLDKLDDPALRLWYAQQAAANGWSRSVLALQIQSELHARLAPAAQTSNFDRVLPPPQSDLARAMIKDPYTFDFLELAAEATERQLERGLVEHISRFLLELGLGFAYVGRQYRLTVGGAEFFLDLLFYHLVLRCYVVIDLKMEPFKPEFAGKMGFYLAAVDAQLKQHADGPAIGLILCTGKNGVVVEYALRDIGAPIGVAEYRVTARMPGKLPESLPPTDVLEAELEAALAAGVQ
ncbi:MAG TPA: PDDEXK nuclease domain-containing protein [Gemmatimonadaceae bacterium]